MSGKRILITGGYGFVGRHLLRALASEGAMLAVLARSEAGAEFLHTLPRHEFLPADLSFGEIATRQICRFEPDTIFHLASRPDGSENHMQTRNCISTNVLGTLQVLEGAREVGADVVIGDSVKTYGNIVAPYRPTTPEAPNSSYAISKLAAWNTAKLYAELYGLKVACVRPTLIYGPGQGLNVIEFVLNRVAENASEIDLYGGAQTRDPLYISDAIRAYIAVADNIDSVLGQTINIGGGAEYSVHDIAELIVRVAGGFAEIKDQPSQTRPTEIWHSVCDNSDASEKIGWRPAITLEAGIKRLVQNQQVSQERQLRMA